jgi:hypothetical protein
MVPRSPPLNQVRDDEDSDSSDPDMVDRALSLDRVVTNDDSEDMDIHMVDRAPSFDCVISDDEDSNDSDIDMVARTPPLDRVVLDDTDSNEDEYMGGDDHDQERLLQDVSNSIVCIEHISYLTFTPNTPPMPCPTPTSLTLICCLASQRPISPLTSRLRHHGRRKNRGSIRNHSACDLRLLKALRIGRNLTSLPSIKNLKRKVTEL